MKVIKINKPDGQYTIPLHNVAMHRADYYIVEKGGCKKDSKDYLEEVEYVMEDDFEGIDWIINNTDWEDWKDLATKINSKVKTTDDEFWSNSEDFEIVEI